MESSLADYINRGIEDRRKLMQNVAIDQAVKELIDEIIICVKSGNKVIFAGNGGSAADSQHLSAELVSRFKFDRPGLAAIAITTDTSAITAIGNDYGFDLLFQRQIQAIGNPGDVLIALTTSGKSTNILKATEYAGEIGISANIFTGQDVKIDHENTRVINFPSTETCFIQEMHMTVGHYICEQVEKILFR